MKSNLVSTEARPGVPTQIDRRRFLGAAGAVGVGAATLGLGLGAATPARAATTGTEDSVAEIVSTLLLAEDLATTFYYNVLVGQVIQAPELAGPGGTALRPASGIRGNVMYMRAAFFQEFTHAALLRNFVGTSLDNSLTFYFPSGTFDTIQSFADTLATLENAFIGAYILAVQEFAAKAALGGAQGGTYTDVDGARYSSAQLIYSSKAAATILGVECEHRILGRVISDREPGDNVLYEQLEGINSLSQGPSSALALLTPFLNPGTGPGFPLAIALANLSSLGLPTSGGLPAPF